MKMKLEFNLKHHVLALAAGITAASMMSGIAIGVFIVYVIRI